MIDNPRVQISSCTELVCVVVVVYVVVVYVVVETLSKTPIQVDL